MHTQTAFGPRRLRLPDLLWDAHRHQLAGFLSQSADMLRAGLPVAQAIEQAASALPAGSLREVAGDLADRLHRGESLAEALERHPALFPAPLPVLVRAGEESGRLEPILDRVARQLGDAVERRKRFLTRLAYPFLLIHLSILARHTSLFGEGTAAYLSRVALDLLVFYGVVASILWLVRWLQRDERWTRRLDRAPFWGTLRIDRARRDFLLVLSSLYAAGVGLRTAFERSMGILAKPRRLELEPGKAALERGSPLTEALRASGWPEEHCRLLATGEVAGQLEESLEHLRIRLDDRVDRLANRLAGGLARALWLLAVLYVLAGILGFYLDYFGRLSSI